MLLVLFALPVRRVDALLGRVLLLIIEVSERKLRNLFSLYQVTHRKYEVNVERHSKEALLGRVLLLTYKSAPPPAQLNRGLNPKP